MRIDESNITTETVRGIVEQLVYFSGNRHKKKLELSKQAFDILMDKLKTDNIFHGETLDATEITYPGSDCKIICVQ